MATDEGLQVRRPPAVFSVQQMLRPATEVLEAAGVVRPQWNAERLLAKRLGCEPIGLYLYPPPVGEECRGGYQWDVAARAAGMPLQYLLGTAEFYGREFEVGPGVFIPRPETEILVEVALGLLDQMAEGSRLKAEGDEKIPLSLDPRALSQQRPTLVDVGTGCGAIAVTLALEWPRARVVAMDRSLSALRFALRNAQRWNARVMFFQGERADVLQPGGVDLLVANLPYLDPQTAPVWPRELAWEPWGALEGGPAGTASIEAWARGAADLLPPRGRMVLEVGEGQVRDVEVLAGEIGLEVERVVQDLAGAERVLVLKPRLPGHCLRGSSLPIRVIRSHPCHQTGLLQKPSSKLRAAT